MIENQNRIWTTYETVLTVTPEPSDVMGAAVTISGDHPDGGFSFALTVQEALLLGSMLNDCLREVVSEVIQ